MPPMGSGLGAALAMPREEWGTSTQPEGRRRRARRLHAPACRADATVGLPRGAAALLWKPRPIPCLSRDTGDTERRAHPASPRPLDT